MISKVIFHVKSIYRTYLLRDPGAIALHNWSKHNGDATLRLDYPLTESSIVFDVGGYKGNWSLQISQRYNPYIFIFEPIPTYFSVIKTRFASNDKVKVHNYGLSDKTETQVISILEDGSSVFRDGCGKVEISLIDIGEYLETANIQHIDLLKINIEGGEYQLLKRMLDMGTVRICKDIQVQFHDFYPNAESLRQQIRERLRKTHFLTYDYRFVWENWRRREDLK